MDSRLGLGHGDVRPDTAERELLQLLDHRYGDGLVYLRDAAERKLYEFAIRLGLINIEGYLTPAGRSLIARHEDD